MAYSVEGLEKSRNPCTAGINAPPLIAITMIAPAVSVYFLFSTDSNVLPKIVAQQGPKKKLATMQAYIEVKFGASRGIGSNGTVIGYKRWGIAN